ncbi:SGNH hydrolase [Pyrrhoderma noxium]|uniref:SGNH hydrolase n=1 Tax=Pyrrhoderma noxium TaxID=2282107 RepID=A0A286UUP5_9AGAM|nr:SGNH hydrolase [Pyrrhoderma noxium]
MAAPVQDAIVLLGDSITQYGWEAGCFAQRLSQDYVRKLDVINRGFSGYNTEWAIPVFRQCLATPEKQVLGKRVEIGLPADREFEVTRKYAEAAKAVGEKEGIPVVDVWTAIWEAAGKEQEGLEKYLIDGLHLTVAGYNIVYERLIKVIKEELPELYHENLPVVFPLWDKIDVNNPLRSLERTEV